MDIDCVIVGVDVAPTLSACLESIRSVEYDRGIIRIFYIDGGSQDHSCAIARTKGAEVLELHPDGPTPGYLRNVGWRAGKAAFVQFLDADVVLSPFWFDRAAGHLRGAIGAVRGRREERHPEASPLDWASAVDWNPTPGNCDAFEGDVLVLREVLEQTSGYDERLLGFQDRELSYRIRKEGRLILNLDASMTVHDLAMAKPHQYWKRAYYTGYGFAAVAREHRKDERGFWVSELERIAIRGGGALAFIVLSILWTLWTVVGLILLVPAALLLLWPRIFGVQKIASQRKWKASKAARYAWHCSFVVVPQFFGAVRYYLGRLFRWPLGK